MKVADIADIPDGLVLPQHFNKLKNAKYTFEPFNVPPQYSLNFSGGVPANNAPASGAAACVNQINTPYGVYSWFVVVNPQTIVVPIFDRVNGLGLDFAQDQATGSGHEIRWGAWEDTVTSVRGKHSFKVGTDPAFFARVVIRGNRLDLMNSADGCNFGFIGKEGHRNVFSSYPNFAGIKVGPGTNPNANLVVRTRLASGSVISYTSTQTVLNDTSVTLEIRVSLKGQVSFFVNGQAFLPVPQFSFNVGQVVHPVSRMVQGTTFIPNFFYQSFECGYLAERGGV